MAGLSGLIGVGRRQKEQALGGLGIAAQQETARKVANEQMDAQRKASMMNVVGTSAGIAGASLLTKAGTTAAVRGATMSAVPGGAASAMALANPGATALGLTAGTTTTTGAALAAGGTTAGAAAGGGASAALLAAAPWAALIIGGGYLLKRLFD